MMEETMEKRVEQEVVQEEDEDDVLLPGFRFHPTDEELVGFYLRRKVEKKPLSIEIIKEIDICKYDPCDLPKVIAAGEECFFFFCLRGRKYKNSIRPNRVTKSGFWKATGIDKPIYSAAGKSGDCIGLKKSLVYYRGSAGKGVKTDWTMHEFRLPSGCKTTANDSPSMQEAEIWTICRIFKRSVSYKKQPNCWKASPNKQIPTDSSSSVTGSLESFIYSNEEMELATNYHQEYLVNNQVYADQWSSITTQAPSYPNIPSPSIDEFFSGDGNWDELGRIMDFMTDLSPLL